MTLIAKKVTCSKCGKKILWNPDVGKMYCPRCKKMWHIYDSYNIKNYSVF